ncbi:hypothetical protein MINS_03250 [Mycolicibacterium insubricum]|nr:hypothetical protein [Mycolicibacterium insubricum]BBZ64896.1 hypothetical protein MINS_03250 [Mycolicibacterium insubricum]
MTRYQGIAGAAALQLPTATPALAIGRAHCAATASDRGYRYEFVD